MVPPMAARRRDPRAASPQQFKRNATVPETCAFYGVADAISSCRVPRSCADCLAKPGCMLTITGSCEDVQKQTPGEVADARSFAAARITPDPRDPIVQIGRLTPLPVFFADNATYCPESDATCTKCRATFELMARTNRSTREALGHAFCVGADGICVCAGVCEVPAYRATTIRDSQCNAPVLYFAAGHSLPDFTSKRRDPRGPLVPRTLARESPETCAYYGRLDTRGCRQPRLASDCIRRMGCMISQLDGCVDAQYPATDLTNATTIHLDLSSTNVRYAAANTSICSPGDTQCSPCGSDIGRYRQGHALDRDNVRCVGSNGCICDAFLAYQDTNWRESKHDSTCGPLNVNPNEVLIAIAVGFVTIVLLVASCIRYAAARGHLQDAVETAQDQATNMMRHMIDHVPGGLELDLFGWRRYHQALRENEARLLQGEENVSPVARPMDLKDWLTPTAPALEESEESTAPLTSDPMTLASAPVGVVDEHFDGDGLTTFPTAPDFDEDPPLMSPPGDGTRQRRSTQSRHVALLES